jgi:hypothetical protein
LPRKLPLQKTQNCRINQGPPDHDLGGRFHSGKKRIE